MSKSNILNHRLFCPPGDICNVYRHFWFLHIVSASGIHWVETRDAVNILQCAEEHSTTRIINPTLSICLT